MSGPFVSDQLIHYRPTYRTLVFCPYPNTIDIYFEDGSITSSEDFIKLPALWLEWVVFKFQKFAGTLERPWLVVHGDYFTKRQWNISPEHLERIRLQGLNIFMYEPVFIYNQDGSWPWSRLNGSPEFLGLNRISAFLTENNISSPVTIHLGEHGLGGWLHAQGLFKNLVFKDFNMYFQETVESDVKHKWPTLPALEITHKFLSLNFRYEALREILVAHLVSRGQSEQGFITFYHFHDRKEFLKRLPFDPTLLRNWEQIEDGIDELQDLLPLTLDVDHPKKCDPILESIPDIAQNTNSKNMWKLRSNYYAKVFVFIFSESRPFSPRSEISEKTIHPLLSKKPFLVFAGPYFLKQLREIGFKTFSDFWDESFDDIEDPKLRLEKYLAVVDSVLEKDISELQEITLKMQPILEFNHNWIVHHAIKHQQQNLLKSGTP